MEQLEPIPQPELKPESRDERQRGNALTVVLAVLVVLAAISLGLAVGWRGAWGRSQAAISNAPVPPPAPVSATDIDRGVSLLPNNEVSIANESKGNSDSPTKGELVVTQDGRVIFRLADDQGNLPAAAVAANQSARRTRSGRLIHRVEPRYPEQARAQNLEGAVVLDVQIGADGAVRNITVLQGDPLLAAAAVDAVRQWQYRPYSAKGRAVEMQERITIRFKLPSS
jgi:TonB family protein